jgi:hypothetical protein
MVGMAADWAKAYNKLSRALEERRALLEAFGGMDLDLIQVANEEWLYMLQEDTHHSLAIEGYFASERELRQVLRGRRGSAEVFNYWTYAASTCTGNRGLKSRLSLPAMSLRRHW